MRIDLKTQLLTKKEMWAINIFMGLLAFLILSWTSSYAQGVTPKPERDRPGKVIPKTQEIQIGNKIIARGIAPIVNNDEKRARQLALQDAYREAISRGVGTEIGELFEMKNFEKIVDVVVKRSIGIVKKYKVLHEGRTKKNENQYEILIEAEVGEGSKGDLMALALFLEVIDSPKVLILLHEYESPSAGTGESKDLEIKIGGKEDTIEIRQRSEKKGIDSLKEVPIDNAEVVLAKYFHDVGYTVLTSKDVLTRNEGHDGEVRLAKQGYTELGRKIGMMHGADIVLIGSIRISGKPVKVYDVPMNMVHVTSTIKAVVTGSGQTLAIEDKTSRSSSEMYEAAKHKSMQGLVNVVGESLVWKIPEVLANNYKILSVTISNCKVDEMKRFTKIISGIKGVETVRTGAWVRQKGDTGKVTLSIYTGFLGATTDEIFDVLMTTKDIKLRTDMLSKYSLELSVNRNGGS